ncbi:hypothetical protein HBI81_077290 [Parastagonospora nodorum]|nr:hypothetical protein HBH53_014530 [Parastagonospora nodorum]KAH5221837.1 hypothetical protein HBI62_134720 [Parastagonospora nodorum]KAH6157628.1 hypothetical protein HBI63_073650 [Parastagonospora nodorum]KAH6177521.1 hypothetical protein HBI61_127150 [Parastagonospora nodorum]KAH6534757.1 hypothetical protein HBI81_077290 [Parastagonospora nodorum]
MEEDLVIDSDSDSDPEEDDELHIDITSAGSKSPNTASYATSLKSGYSRSYSFVSGTSIHVLNDESDEIDTVVSSLPSSIEGALDDLAPFALKFPKFRPRQSVQPCRESLCTLGRLVDESVDEDWALIEITNAQAIESMNALIVHEGTRVHAYDTTASCPTTEDTMIFTYTASGGKLSGVLSGATSYSRVPNGSAFREIYHARMDGPLANGDCGSAIMDVHTKETYGHLIAGCRTSGTAYVLAAHQMVGDLERISRLVRPEQFLARDSLYESPSPSFACEPQLKETAYSDSKTMKGHVDATHRVCAKMGYRAAAYGQSLSPNGSNRHHTQYGLRSSPHISRRIRKLPRKQFIDPQTKRWRDVFFTKRLFYDEPFFTARECITGFEREDGPLDAFLEDAESSIPAWEMTVIIDFLQSKRPYSTSIRHLARAKLDDREHGSGQCRDHPEWLTSNQLHDVLLKQRFECSDSPDADRRLIVHYTDFTNSYIHQPDADYMLALIRTVYCHQTEALRDTLWKYISFKTSIRVSIPLFDKFVLEFHLAFLTLRNVTNSDTSASTGSAHYSGTELDVSFLVVNCVKHRGQKCSCKHIIRESQISVVICGWDNQNWVGWGLFNTSSDPTDEYDPEDQRELREDYYAADGEGGTVIDADEPIWDPRRYWLRIIDVRLQLVLKEWVWLVRNLEAGVAAWKRRHPILSARSPTNGQHNDIRELFDWTIQTMQLLRLLQERFARTTQTWARFCAADGDRSFFADVQDSRSLLVLDSLQVSFQSFEDLQQDLASLDQSCKETKDILSLCLEHENNRVSLEIQQLSYRTHIISCDIQKLNREGTEAAIATVAAAQDTSRYTRTNVQVIWVMAPVLLALQYFGVDKDILPFERNATSFIIALVILVFALPFLTYGLSYSKTKLKALFDRMGIWPRKTVSETDRPNNFELQPHFSVLAGA